MVPCGQRLSCWTAFYKHQIQHCTKNHKGQTRFICRLKSCSAKLHSSEEGLKTHIRSHLKNLPLPCPFIDCKPVDPGLGLAVQLNTFTRIIDLTRHFEEMHSHLFGLVLDAHSAILLPRWEPCQCPTHPLPRPPPLPVSILPPGSLFAGPIRVQPTARLIRLMSDNIPFPSLPAAHNPKSVRPRKRLQIQPTRDETAHNQLYRRDGPYEFADLPKVVDNHDIAGSPDFVVQRVGEGLPFRKDLARPLPMCRMPMRERPPPPTSIFYDTLRKQVLQEYAEGETDLTNS
ncbi:hypothetical protein B0H15DRAFT_300556 [Mycena belliarum]|uniref:Uncharacterized protein n=1 Tax=Mycena belliarum TaxID=1033014 RepID=A0AAD6XQQ2_9AGAR|nr:hypothetical protein B0H15DRAFT_300556 [Mycena belliae]